MKASFDGARKQLVGEFNDLARSGLSFTQLKIMEQMRITIIGLLCMVDEREHPDDCNFLADDEKLEHIDL